MTFSWGSITGGLAMERLGTKTSFFLILFLCGSCFMLLIKSNQISSETATGVSSACNPGIPLQTLSMAFLSVVSCPAESPAVSAAHWALIKAPCPPPEHCCSWNGIADGQGCALSWPMLLQLELKTEEISQHLKILSQSSIHNSVLLFPFLEGLFHFWPVLQTILKNHKADTATFSVWRGTSWMVEIPPFQRCLAAHGLS